MIRASAGISVIGSSRAARTNRLVFAYGNRSCHCDLEWTLPKSDLGQFGIQLVLADYAKGRLR